jgi:uncharacterized protein (DUF362 family)
MSERSENRIISRWFAKSFNRREFLKTNLKGAFILAAGSSGLLFPRTGLSQAAPDIVVAKGSPVDALKAAIKQMGGMATVVKPGNRVLIKPNMSWASKPEMAANTNPLLVKELAMMCKEAGASSIVITDYTLQEPQSCLLNSGIQEACKDIPGVSVTSANSDALYKDTEFPDAVSMKKNGVHKEALRADILIAVPIAKTHMATGVSLSMKGMMGLVWDRRSMHMNNLSSSIVDMCMKDLRADLTVIDASRVLSTNGPGGPGNVLVENTVIVSKDMVAADAYAISSFEWYGKKYEPKQVEHIRLASERGLGRMDLENMTIKKLTI